MEFVNACLIESMNMRHEIHEQNIMNSMNYNDLFRVHEMHEQASCCVNSTFAELLEKQKNSGGNMWDSAGNSWIGGRNDRLPFSRSRC